MSAAVDRTRLTVSVESPSGRHSLALPNEARVEDLMPGILQACEGPTEATGWQLAPQGEAALVGNRTIGECGLFPGAVLILSAPAAGVVAPHWSTSEGFSLGQVTALAGKLKTRLRPVEPPSNIDRVGDAAYRHLLEDAIVAARSGASSVVAVVSVRPGAGTTTLTALLATLLSALRGDRLTVVDASPQSAALSHWLSPDKGLSSDAYGSLFGARLTPDQVQRGLVSAGPGLWVLPAADHASAKMADATAWGRLIQHLRHLSNTVIIDCGAGVQRPACQAAIDAADHVVLVCKPQAGELERMTRTIEAIRGRGPTVVVVMNQARRPARVKRSADGVQHVTIAYEKASGVRLKSRGFSWGQAPASWQEGVRELAAVLAGSGPIVEDPTETHRTD